MPCAGVTLTTQRLRLGIERLQVTLPVVAQRGDLARWHQSGVAGFTHTPVGGIVLHCITMSQAHQPAAEGYLTPPTASSWPLRSSSATVRASGGTTPPPACGMGIENKRMPPRGGNRRQQPAGDRDQRGVAVEQHAAERSFSLSIAAGRAGQAWMVQGVVTSCHCGVLFQRLAAVQRRFSTGLTVVPGAAGRPRGTRRRCACSRMRASPWLGRRGLEQPHNRADVVRSASKQPMPARPWRDQSHRGDCVQGLGALNALYPPSSSSSPGSVGRSRGLDDDDSLIIMSTFCGRSPLKSRRSNCGKTSPFQRDLRLHRWRSRRLASAEISALILPPLEISAIRIAMLQEAPIQPARRELHQPVPWRPLG